MPNEMEEEATTKQLVDALASDFWILRLIWATGGLSALIPWPMHWLAYPWQRDKFKLRPEDRPVWMDTSGFLSLALVLATFAVLDVGRIGAFQDACGDIIACILSGLGIVGALLALGVAIPGNALMKAMQEDPVEVADYAMAFMWPFIWAVPSLVMLCIEDKTRLLPALEPAGVWLTVFLATYSVGQILKSIGFAVRMFIGGALIRNPPN